LSGILARPRRFPVGVPFAPLSSARVAHTIDHRATGHPCAVVAARMLAAAPPDTVAPPRRYKNMGRGATDAPALPSPQEHWPQRHRTPPRRPRRYKGRGGTGSRSAALAGTKKEGRRPGPPARRTRLHQIAEDRDRRVAELLLRRQRLEIRKLDLLATLLSMSLINMSSACLPSCRCRRRQAPPS
jgi:hypothetical protein